MLSTKDKTDIVMALREAARGIEQSIGPELALATMQIIGGELLILALKNGPLLTQIEGENAPPETRQQRADHLEKLIRVEIAAIADSIARLHEARITESDIVNERLTRMFDPYAAWNEGLNRAIERKMAAKEDIPRSTKQQKYAFENFQWPSGMNALLNAGREAPQPPADVDDLPDADSLQKVN